MRTTSDLIAELDAERERFYVVGLAVGFEDTTIFVFGSDPNRLQTLNDALGLGGEPVGMIGVTRQPGHVTVFTRPLDEFRDEPEIGKFLESLAGAFAERLKLENPEKGAGWVN